jgi:MYXO-CTERM domain-containing protein
MVLDATGALVRSFRPFSSEAIGTGERAYVVSGSSVYVVTEDEDTVVPVARGSAAGGGRWAFGTTTSTGAWLAMRDGSGHQVLTVDALGRPLGHGFLGLSGRVGVGVPMVSEEGIVLAVQVDDAVLFALPSAGSAMVPGPYTSSAGSTLLDATWARAQPRTLLVSAWNDVRLLESVWTSDPGRIVAPLPSGTGRRILPCEEGLALYQREGDAIVGYAVSDEASVGERWPVGTSEHDLAVSRGDGDAAIAWVDRGGRLFAARLDAQCRPLGRTQLATIPSLAHLGVASRGRELVAAWIATEGGPLEAVASTPSGRSPPIRIAEQTTRATPELILRLPGDGYLFTWTSSDLTGGVERPWLRLAHLSDTALDAGNLDAGNLDDFDAGSADADPAGGPDGGPPLPVGCGCRTGRAPKVSWGMLVLVALVAIRRRPRWPSSISDPSGRRAARGDRVAG